MSVLPKENRPYDPTPEWYRCGKDRSVCERMVAVENVDRNSYCLFQENNGNRKNAD